MGQKKIYRNTEKPLEQSELKQAGRHMAKESVVTSALEAGLAAAILWFAVQGFHTGLIFETYPLFLAGMAGLLACLAVMPPRMEEHTVPLTLSFYSDFFTAESIKRSVRGGYAATLYICFYGRIEEIHAGEQGIYITGETCTFRFRIPPELAAAMDGRREADPACMEAADRMCRRVKVRVVPAVRFRTDGKDSVLFREKIEKYAGRDFCGQGNIRQPGTGTGRCHEGS